MAPAPCRQAAPAAACMHRCWPALSLMYQHARKPRGPRAAPAQFGTVDHVLRNPLRTNTAKSETGYPKPLYSTIWNCHCICPDPASPAPAQFGIATVLRKLPETPAHNERNRLPRPQARHQLLELSLYCESAPKQAATTPVAKVPNPLILAHEIGCHNRIA